MTKTPPQQPPQPLPSQPPPQPPPQPQPQAQAQAQAQAQPQPPGRWRAWQPLPGLRGWRRLALGGVAGAAVLALLALAWQGWRGLRDGPDEQRSYRSLADGRSLDLHLFKPPGWAAGQQRAAVLFFHGGAWQHGHPRQFYPQCRLLAAQGLVCASASYRLGSTHGAHPADAVQDARQALRYLRQHAQALGIRPDRMAAGGGSAGGHLAAALGTALPLPDDAAQAPAGRPNALLLLNPMLDLSPGQPDHGLVGAQWLALSPAQHVDAAVPPTLVQSGTADADVPVATVQAFCQRVQAQGGRCALVLYPGARHGFFNPGQGDGTHHRDTNAAMLGFLRQLGWL